MNVAGDFLQSRWQGRAPLPRLFWRDMLGIGTLINVLASFVALMMAAQGASGAAAAAMHFAPTPLNLFLALCVMRHPAAGPARRVVAVGWAAVMMLV
jgi:hypothetical protein